MSKVETNSSRWGGVIELQPQQLIQVALLGLVVGLVVWLIMLFMRDVALVALLCAQESSANCATTTTNTAGVISTIIGGVVGLLGLVKLGVYRPIIVIIASVICLWSLNAWTHELLWFESVAWYGVLYALLYALFSWLVRPRSIVVVLLVVIPVVVMVHLVSVL